MQQTIKVTTRTTPHGITLFSINGVCIAHVGKDANHAGRYAGRINHAGGEMCNNMDYCDAIEFIGDAICRTLGAYGLNVEFVAA